MDVKTAARETQNLNLEKSRLVLAVIVDVAFHPGLTEAEKLKHIRSWLTNPRKRIDEAFNPIEPLSETEDRGAQECS